MSRYEQVCVFRHSSVWHALIVCQLCSRAEEVQLNCHVINECELLFFSFFVVLCDFGEMLLGHGPGHLMLMMCHSFAVVFVF